MVTTVREMVTYNGVDIAELISTIGEKGKLPVITMLEMNVLSGYTPDGRAIYGVGDDPDMNEYLEKTKADFTVKVMRQHEVLLTIEL